MCYSAIVEADLRTFWRNYRGVLSYQTVKEIFRQRLTNNAIKIPKAFEANFERSDKPEDIEIRALIDRHRAAEATKLEKEVFTQKKRLAEAERKLKMKETKALLNDLRVAPNKIKAALAKLEDLKRTELKSRDSRIFPFNYAPILLQEDGETVIKLARYHLRQARQPASIDKSKDGLYNARRDNLERFWREEFGVTHALMIVDSFYENVRRDDENAVLHFMPKPGDPMMVACLYGVWHPGQEDELLSFAAVTDEPPPEIAAAGHNRCPINLKPENVEKWLTPEGRSTEELQAILEDRQRPYYAHELMAA